jgi:hypothetical protein
VKLVKNSCVLYLDHAEDGKETTNTDAPENNTQYTTVYVGNLASEVKNYLPYISLLFCSFTLSSAPTYTAHTHIKFVLPWL